MVLVGDSATSWPAGRSRLIRGRLTPEDAGLGSPQLDLFAAMGVIWGVPYLFIKVAVEHLAPPVVVFGRTAVAIVPLLFVATRSGAIRPALAEVASVAGVRSPRDGRPMAAADRRRASASVGATGLLIACVPIVGAVVAFLLGDRRALAPRRLAGIALGLGGVALLVAADLGGTASWWSVARCCWSASVSDGAVHRRSPTRRRPDVGVVAVSLTVVAIVYAPIAWFARPDEAPPADAVGGRRPRPAVHGRRLRAVLPPDRRRRAGRSTLITFVNPAVAVIVGAVFLDEQITAATVGGFALVLAGCWLATRHEAEVIAEVPVVIEPLGPS